MPNILLINPHKRGTKGKEVQIVKQKNKGKGASHKKGHGHKAKSFKRNPINDRHAGKKPSSRRKFRRNPIGGIVELAAPVAIGAASSVLTDVVIQKVDAIPYDVKNGPLRHVIKAGAVTLAGFAAGFATKNKAIGRKTMMVGLGIVLDGALRDGLKRLDPTMNLGEAPLIESYQTGADGMPIYDGTTMGEYFPV